MNPHAVQMAMNEQQGGPFGGDMGEDDGGDFGEEESEAGDENGGADENGDFGEDDNGNGWGDIQQQAGNMGKSLNRRGVVRIVV
jgi:hypothetical protein